ncbi:MAG: hypothetical protein HDP34_05310 [Clostridia bacterium]|nr:hypothetical protein [Clostridia bacterium]
MPNFEDLRLIDLLERFEEDINEIYLTRSLKTFKRAGENLQSVYNFYVTAQNPFKEQEELFKNLCSSFNYAAVIINDALKRGGLSKDDNGLLNDCIEIMLACCEKLKLMLKN